MPKTLTTRIILRNDTSTNWNAVKPVLLKGEIGLETDTGRYKIGNGTDAWDLLSYYSNISLADKNSLDSLIKLLNDDAFGKVEDVQVNGETVLDGKIANIKIGDITFSEESQVVDGTESLTGKVVLHKIAKTGLNVVDNLDSTSVSDALSANQGNLLKKMVQALPSAVSYTNIQTLIAELNSYETDKLNVGLSLYLQQLGVPDFWVYSKEETAVEYTYVDDETFISEVQTNGFVQVGFYKLSLLETAKVDLTNYYTKTEIDSKLPASFSEANMAGSDGAYYGQRMMLNNGKWMDTYLKFFNGDFSKTSVNNNSVGVICLSETVVRTTDTLILDGGSSEV